MKYRIVRDSYAGYEVQFKTWWWPFWHQAPGIPWHASSFFSFTDAKQFAESGGDRTIVQGETKK